MTNFKRKAIPLLVAACLASAQAAPTLPQVVSGQATFAQQGNVFSITNTPNTIINWQSFSVNPGEITRFIQQSDSSAVLNRILGQDPSQILGALQSNGRVFLINPNGIVFGANARVDVNGLTASTLNLSNADFLAGKKNFTAGASAGAISNQGAISTPGGGQVFLIAPNVENSGIITAPGGDVVLAAGHSVQLVDSSNPDLHVVVSSPADQAINLGQVIAQGGRIGIYGALVNQRGLVSANSALVGENGKIVLKSSADTLLEAGSVTSASGAGNGGDIHVLGARVGLTGDARIDASGALGGGNVLVGGAYQGGNPQLPNAQQTWFGKDASISADATGSGKGGTVVLWSDGATRAFGSISARGGAAGGDGGLVETSGHYLDVTGALVNTGAARGKTGGWLLDPFDIEVAAVTNSVTLSDVSLFANPPGTGVTQVSASLLAGATSNITLQAQNDLTFSSALITNPHINLTAQAGHNINVNAPITGRGDLDFRAGNVFSTTAPGVITGSGYIDIKANDVNLGAAITGNGTLPIVSFSTTAPSRDIDITTAGTGSLALSPTELGLISAFEINIGNSAHTGTINVSAPFTPAAGKLTHLVLETAGSVQINANVDLTTANANSSFTATNYWANYGWVDIGSHGAIKAKTVTLGADNIGIAGPIIATGGSVTLTPLSTGTPIMVGGFIDVVGLTLDATALSFIHTRDLTIGGQPGQYGGLGVYGVLNLSTNLDPSGTLTLNAGEGSLILERTLSTPGGLSLQSLGDITQIAPLTATSGNVAISAAGIVTVASDINAGSQWIDISALGGIRGAGTLKAGKIALYSQHGIGDATTPLHTQTSYLAAQNSASVGSSPINIVNTGNLTLGNVAQYGEGPGAITIENYGAMTVPQYEPVYAADSATTPVTIRAYGGAIKLITHSPLTVNGTVRTNSGNIRLEAGNGGLLTVGSTGQVNANGGNIDLVAGSFNLAGGIITTGDGYVHQSGSVAPPPPPPPPPPSVSSCLQTPQLSGCAAVLAEALPACLGNPTGADCGGILQKALSACIANPEGANCQALLPTFEKCLGSPSTAGCEVRLPTLAVCAGNLSTPGCTVVVPSLLTCAATPGTPGCATVNACLASPTLAGCSAFLPTLTSCIANPSAVGCLAILPSLPACIANPQTLGCVVVLPTLPACIAAPTTAGCVAVLPTLPACIAAPTTAGCIAVLPTLTACIAAPTTAGCIAVLPTLPACIVAPTKIGCSVVLPTLAACISAPTTQGCSVVLPTLGQCVATPSKAGCSVVLPTLVQCIASPTLQGCSVVLPTLAQCAASPTMQGCTVVLPTPSFCDTHPADAACVQIKPPSEQAADGAPNPVAKASSGFIVLANTSNTAGSDKSDGSANQSKPGTGGNSAPAGNTTGVDNGKPVQKLYCN